MLRRPDAPCARCGGFPRYRDSYCQPCSAWFARLDRERHRAAYNARSSAYMMRTGRNNATTREHPEVARAYRIVRRELAAGRFVRPATCEQCGQSGRIQAAHSDYSRPLDIRWLCRSCHTRWDLAEPKLYGVAAGLC